MPKCEFCGLYVKSSIDGSYIVYRRISSTDRTSNINRTPNFASQILNIFNLKSSGKTSDINRSADLIGKLRSYRLFCVAFHSFPATNKRISGRFPAADYVFTLFQCDS